MPASGDVSQELKQKVAERAAAFEEVFFILRTSKLPHISEMFTPTALNRKLLSLALRSYFIDIERTKIFHKLGIADRHKQAGYTMKWICKIKPLQRFTASTTPLSYVANECFAFYCGLDYLEIPNSHTVETKAWQAFMYTLHYRELSGDHLALTAYCLENSTISAHECKKLKQELSDLRGSS